MKDDVFYLLHCISKSLKSVADAEIARFGFTSTEVRVLNVLYYKDGSCGQDEIDELLEIDRSNVGRSIKKLENLGYLKRERDKRDKRAFLVSLTRKGEEIENTLLDMRKRLMKTFFEGISQGDRKYIVSLLQKADSNLQGREDVSSVAGFVIPEQI